MFRVIVYVDGFNLYYGIREVFERKYLWLNIESFAQSILKPNQVLCAVKYFTSRITDSASKQKRQSLYLDALETLKKVKIIYGSYIPSLVTCSSCNYQFTTHHEKKTDVNIATSLLCDAFEDKFDTAILISGDSDLVPPLEIIRDIFHRKRVIVFFPPMRYRDSLNDVAHATFNITRSMLAKHQFPEIVIAKGNTPLQRPASWH